MIEHALSKAAPRMQVPAERNERRETPRYSALGAGSALITFRYRNSTDPVEWDRSVLPEITCIEDLQVSAEDERRTS